ncbi:MAG: single-stranded-DNA-specific exonuclease RecJ [Candidatus Uhrbacteria bacterium]|nr:single-stranded-DNA-specific exonuclease RecJ [Candidatus Uhrbacteria bacterium]
MPALQGQVDIFSIAHDITQTEPESDLFHSTVLEIMKERGVFEVEDIRRFTDPDYERDSHDPFLFDDMSTSVDRILRAVSKREKICIYGDYDVDGVCATVILYETLIKFGGDVSVRINHRDDEGYGLHANVIDELARSGISLIITTDQGISNTQEVDHATCCGIDTIITDHHTVPDDPEMIPRAVGIIHPRVHADRYPFKDLSGGGAAFKLAQGIIRTAAPHTREWQYFERWFLDLVCMSTLADCVPLVGENKVFLHFGLTVLNKMRRVGIRALLSVAPIRTSTITTHSILFYLSPLLNAASRMDHAQLAFDILTVTKLEKAKEIAGILAVHNKERQKLTTRITREAHAQCKIQTDNQILVGSSPQWPLGVLGLVAGTLVRKYNKPVVLISEKSDRNIGVARSTADIHITRTFQKIEPLFDRFGGHHRAGGFALKEGVSTAEFVNQINGVIHDEHSAPARDVRDEKIYPLGLHDITLEFANQLKRCQPWGTGNPEPTFCIPQCVLTNMSRVGKKMQHLRLHVQQDNERRTMIGIKKGASEDELKVGDILTIFCHIDIGTWQGKQDIFIKIIDYSKQPV